MRALALILLLFQYHQALPGYRWSFPADDFAHPGFANEWWYFIGNLNTPSGRAYGFELTFFRVAAGPDSALKEDTYIAHFAITDVAAHHFFYKERLLRGLWGQAGISVQRIWSENWTADFDANGPRQLRAVWGTNSLDLHLESGPRVLNGIDGVMPISDGPGQASLYYSYPRLATSGKIDGAAVSGSVWMDHEFASNMLAAGQQGWDWMGLQLPETTLMLTRLRGPDNSTDPHSSLMLGGKYLGVSEFLMTPLRWWQRYPIAWRVEIPREKMELDVEPQLDNQELRTTGAGVEYWEGAVRVSGNRAGKPVAGVGYLELAGYANRLDRLHQTYGH